VSGFGRLLRPGTLHAVLIGAAAGLVGGSGRTWAAGASTADPVTGLAVHTALAGTALAPAVRPLALAVLAGAGALLLVRGRAKAALAALLALLAAAACFLAIRAAVDPRATAWSVVGAFLGLVSTFAAAALAVRSRALPVSVSQRFDAPGTGGSAAGDDAWSALDRGEDPTA
jgi:hypothetical protein